MNTVHSSFPLEKSVLRYLVPFYLDSGNRESDAYTLYQHACTLMDRDPLWLQDDSLKDQEDLHDHVTAQFIRQDPCTVARGWKRALSASDKHPVCLFVGREGTLAWLTINDAGLFLFPTGVGFLWYELTTDAHLSAEDMLLMQNQLKETGRESVHLLGCRLDGAVMKSKRQKYIAVPDWAAFTQTEGQETVSLRYADSGKACKVSAAQLMQLAGEYGMDWHIHNRKLTPAVSVVRTVNRDGLEEYRLYPVFSLVQHLLDSVPVALHWQIHYFSGVTRHPVDAYGTQGKLRLPDRALPFLYLQEDAEDHTALKQHAFFLANGYHQNYNMPEDANCRELLGSAFYHACRSGCAFVHHPGKNDPEFLNTGFQARFRKEYFTLFLLAMYQHYALLNFTRRITAELSSNPRDFLCKPENAQRTDDLSLEINTFLLKSEFTSVSAIQHHDVFYAHLREQLSIEGDVSSVRNGLEALSEIQHSNRDRAETARENSIQHALVYLSVLTVASALCDSQGSIINLVEQFRALGTPGAGPGDWLSFVLTLLCWAVVLFVSFKVLAQLATHLEADKPLFTFKQLKKNKRKP